MQILKDFPVKDLLFKLSTIVLLCFLFKIVQTKIDSRDVKKETSIQTLIPQIIETKKIKDISLNKQKETLKIIDKLNAYIEEQAFLLSQLDRNKPEFCKKVNLIKENLEEIEKAANKKQLLELIDHPLIAEIKYNIESYRRTISA